MAAVTLEAVLARMESAAIRAGREPGSVSLVAVSKGRTVEQILEIYRQGQRHFGESRAQELAIKAPALPGDVAWHFVGPLQANKVRLVRPIVTLLHSLDRTDLGSAWMKHSGPAPPTLLQVNVGREPQKLGVSPEQALLVAARLLELGVVLNGLMTVPPLVGDPEDARQYFRDLRRLAESMNASLPSPPTLSMGMTDDFEVAVEEGATLIRVGRAIFDADS
jgi:pyridoxal phosphate enzyme (YggS family)